MLPSCMEHALLTSLSLTRVPRSSFLFFSCFLQFVLFVLTLFVVFSFPSRLVSFLLYTLNRCSDVSPGVGMRHLEGPKNPDGQNLDIHIFVYVYKVHMCIYMLRGWMRSWTNCFFSLTYFFFRKRKAKDVNANHR